MTTDGLQVQVVQVVTAPRSMVVVESPAGTLGQRASVVLLPADTVVTVQSVAAQGPPGESAPLRQISAVCDDSCAAGTPLYVSRVDGHLRQANADLKNTSWVAGLAAFDTRAGFVASARTDCLSLPDWRAITGTTTLAPGQVYFLGWGGGLTTNPPSSPGVNTLVGTADDAHTLTLKLHPPIQL